MRHYLYVDGVGAPVSPSEMVFHGHASQDKPSFLFFFFFFFSDFAHARRSPIAHRDMNPHCLVTQQFSSSKWRQNEQKDRQTDRPKMNRRMERQKRTADGRKIEEMKDMLCTMKKRKTDWPKKRLTKSLQKI